MRAERGRGCLQPTLLSPAPPRTSLPSRWAGTHLAPPPPLSSRGGKRGPQGDPSPARGARRTPAPGPLGPGHPETSVSAKALPCGRQSCGPEPPRAAPPARAAGLERGAGSGERGPGRGSGTRARSTAASGAGGASVIAENRDRGGGGGSGARGRGGGAHFLESGGAGRAPGAPAVRGGAGKGQAPHAREVTHRGAADAEPGRPPPAGQAQSP